MHYITKSSPLEKGKLWLGSAFVAIPGEQQWGTFSAINVDTGKIAWQVKTEQPMIGGALATAGGLVFVGEANGFFRAYDDRSGKKLWEFQAGAGVNSAPMTFEIGGEQLVAVAAGGNFQIQAPYGDDLLVFALPKRR
jgi:glucose dehydrogenase